ncbi:MAG: lysylphosphatidylglycerol synthase domain-containing protein [Actinomycetota bacterium]
MSAKDWARRRSVRTSVRLLLATAVFYFVGSVVARNWGQIRAADISADPWLLTVSVVVLMAYFFGRAVLWHMLTIGSGIAIRFPDAVAAWFYSQLGKYLPGKAFLYLGRLAYYRRQHRSAAALSATFLVETLATLLASVVMLLLALMTVDTGLGRWRPLLGGALVALVIALHPRLIDWAMSSLLRLFKRAPRRFELSAGNTYGFVTAYFCNWIVCGLAFYLLLDSLYPTSPDLILYLAGSFSFASLVGMFSVFVPSGLGVREGVLIVMLSQVMPTEIAITASLGARLWFTLAELIAIGTVRLITGIPMLGKDDLQAARNAESAKKPTESV